MSDTLPVPGHTHRVPQIVPGGVFAQFAGGFQPSGRVGVPARVALQWPTAASRKPGLNADIALDENSNAAAHLAANIADRDFEVLGTNMTSALCTYNPEGGITLTTAGASGDSAILLPHLDANQTRWTTITWGTDQETEYEVWLVTGAAITSTTIWAGLKLTNTDTVATDNDQVFLRYQNGVNSGAWQVISSIGGTDTTTNTTVTVATSTSYLLKIRVRSNRTAEVWLNGRLLYVTAALTDATDLIPYVGVKAGAAAAKAVTVRGCAIGRKFA